jgi:hypothetical protein
MTRGIVGLLCWTLLVVGSSEAAGPFRTVGKVTRVGTGLSGEGLYVTLDVKMQNALGGCKDADTAFLPTTAIQYRETNAIVLLSIAQARPLTVFYDDTCHGPQVVLRAAAIEFIQ